MTEEQDKTKVRNHGYNLVRLGRPQRLGADDEHDAVVNIVGETRRQLSVICSR